MRLTLTSESRRHHLLAARSRQTLSPLPRSDLARSRASKRLIVDLTHPRFPLLPHRRRQKLLRGGHHADCTGPRTTISQLDHHNSFPVYKRATVRTASPNRHSLARPRTPLRSSQGRFARDRVTSTSVSASTLLFFCPHLLPSLHPFDQTPAIAVRHFDVPVVL